MQCQSLAGMLLKLIETDPGCLLANMLFGICSLLFEVLTLATLGY